MTIQIRIYKLNHASIKIDCDMDIALELSEAFKFQVPGFRFMPSFKMGTFDGYIRLFNLGTRIIPSGLFYKVIEFAKVRDYTYELVDQPNSDITPVGYQTPGIDNDSVADYIDTLNLHARGVPLAVRDYQVNGVTIALRDRQAILVSSVGSGKSAMLYCIIRYITEVIGKRVLLIVPTVGLTTQMKSDFEDYSSHNNYCVEDNMHLITAGVDKNTDKSIVVSTFQSLKDISSEWLNGFGAIITDEGHKITAKSFQDIYNKATKVPFRLACTGTIHDIKCNVLQMIGLTGPVHEIALAKVLIKNNQLVPLKIQAISLNYPEEICKQFKKIEYTDELNWIISNPKRNKFIAKLANSCTGTTLIFYRFVDHGKELQRLIQDIVGDTRKVYIINGKVDKDDREIIRQVSNDGTCIILASYATSSAGINMPAVANMIIAHPIKSRITFLQGIGRGLRLSEGKEFCSLFDIGDNLCHKSAVNTTYRHFGERLQLLTSEGYDFKILNVPFG